VGKCPEDDYSNHTVAYEGKCPDGTLGENVRRANCGKMSGYSNHTVAFAYEGKCPEGDLWENVRIQ